MEKATTILSEEHKHILKVIDSITKECEKIENENNIKKEFFNKAIDFIKNYADKFHHVKEENILFKELCKEEVEGKMHCNPTQQMLHEHTIGREFVKGMIQSLEENNKKKLLENAIGYTNLLQDHIFKEDNILYPMADEVLTEEKQEEILVACEKAEKELFEKGTKEKYIELAEELSKK